MNKPKISPDFVKIMRDKYKNFDNLVEQASYEAELMRGDDLKKLDSLTLMCDLLQALKESKEATK